MRGLCRRIAAGLAVLLIAGVVSACGRSNPPAVVPHVESVEPSTLAAIDYPHNEERQFLKINNEAAVFTTELPHAPVNAALSLVGKEVATVETPVFEKGYQYDFNKDGKLETFVVVNASMGEQDWFDGYLHFVLVTSDGTAHYLFSGTHIDSHIFKYTDEAHLTVEGGNDTAASGDYFQIYSLSEDAIKMEYAGSWYDVYEDTFLMLNGPQGMCTTFLFWDTLAECYSYVGGIDFSKEAFLGDAAVQKAMQEVDAMGRELLSFTEEEIKWVSLYGNAFYIVGAYTEESPNFHWVSKEDKLSALSGRIMFPPFIDETDSAAADVDMNLAIEQAK